MSKNKRRQNLEENTAFLKARGISFTSHNQGFHLIVENRFDFWPSTGKYLERKPWARPDPRGGLGVKTLIGLLPPRPDKIKLPGEILKGELQSLELESMDIEKLRHIQKQIHAEIEKRLNRGSEKTIT